MSRATVDDTVVNFHTAPTMTTTSEEIATTTPRTIENKKKEEKNFENKKLIKIKLNRLLFGKYERLQSPFVQVPRVMVEADRILNMDFEMKVDKILRVIPRERRTRSFSATITTKVQKLQRTSLRNPVKVEVSTKDQIVEKLQQYNLFIPAKFKDIYLVHIVEKLSAISIMIFCNTCNGTVQTALLLRNLGFMAVPLHGQMSQNKRLATLKKFQAKNRSILVSADIANRGLDIPHVDIFINFDVQIHSKDYINRLGRTARIGRSGPCIAFVTQYDIELYRRIEHLLSKKLPLFSTKEDEVNVAPGQRSRSTANG